MSAHTDIQEGLAEAFDALGAEFFENTTAILCKQSLTTREFEDVIDIGNQIGPVWFFEYSAFRENFLLQIAYDGEILQDVRSATHVKIDDEYYIIRQADTVEPKGTDVTWKFFCDRFPERGQFSNLI